VGRGRKRVKCQGGGLCMLQDNGECGKFLQDTLFQHSYALFHLVVMTRNVLRSSNHINQRVRAHRKRPNLHLIVYAMCRLPAEHGIIQASQLQEALR
jgi:hypothetical protein